MGLRKDSIVWSERKEKRNRKQRVFQRGSAWLGDDIKNVREHSNA